MKQSFRILSAAVLTVIYCYAMVHGSRPVLHPGIQGRPSSDTEWYISAVTDNLLCHTPPTEPSVNQSYNFNAPNFKVTFPGPWTLVRAGEQLYKTGFLQYCDFTESLLILHRKSDIIFPFHYFW